MTRRASEQVGDRIRRYRDEKGLSLNELAKRAEVSKSYLWRLENETEANRPSGDTLYRIGTALGVTMSDLLGQRMIVTSKTDVPKSLKRFAAEARLPQSDVEMLASIEFRGDRPQTPDRWRYIYEAIKMSKSLDS